MIKTLSLLQGYRDRISNELIVAKLKLDRNQKDEARKNLGNIGLIVDDISGIIQRYLAFGEEEL